MQYSLTFSFSSPYKLWAHEEKDNVKGGLPPSLLKTNKKGSCLFRLIIESCYIGANFFLLIQLDAYYPFGSGIHCLFSVIMRNIYMYHIVVFLKYAVSKN